MVDDDQKRWGLVADKPELMGYDIFGIFFTIAPLQRNRPVFKLNRTNGPCVDMTISRMEVDRQIKLLIAHPDFKATQMQIALLRSIVDQALTLIWQQE